MERGHTKFPGFSFCRIYPKVGSEETGNLELPMGTEKN